MERNNWTLSKYSGSEFISGWVYIFFFPDWIFVTSDSNPLWAISGSDLQTFQMENIIWKQNKCFLGCGFPVMRIYLIGGVKTEEKLSCACWRNEFATLRIWDLHWPPGGMGSPQRSPVPPLPLLSPSHHNDCGFWFILFILVYSLYFGLFYYVADPQPECGTGRGKDGRGTECCNPISKLHFTWERNSQ